jgi:hypothetical protein
VIFAAIVMAIGGSLLVAFGRAATRGMLKPNGWAGIRTRATLASDEAWYATHAAGGRWITIAGWVITIAGLAILLIRPDDDTASQIALWGGILAGASVLYGGYLGHRAARDLAG